NVGNGSFERVGSILELERNDEETVAGVMRAVITKWLDRYDPKYAVETALTDLSIRLLDQYSKKQTERAEKMRAGTEHLQEDTRRMDAARKQYEAARSPEERDRAFAEMRKALAGEK